MKLIGIKRLVLLGILIALNAAIAAGYFLWVDPARNQAQVKLKAMKSDISTLQGKIQNTKIELAEYQKNLPAYRQLESRGFIAQPDRFQIPRDLDRIRLDAQLGSFSFNINVKDVLNAEAENAKLKVYASRISVSSISSVLDTPFYDFLDLMVTDFPSHVRLQKMVIGRKDALNAAALQRIAQGEPVSLLVSEAEFDWITALPESATGAEQPGGPGRGR